MPADDQRLTPAQRAFVLLLQEQALRYFLDNQVGGMVRDRQRNREPPELQSWCSTSATGMGLIALALASADPYRLLGRDEAVGRVRAALETALERLPADHGMMPHFVEADTLQVRGDDVVSTIDSSWLLAGALFAAAFLRDATVEALAGRLFDRVEWDYWAVTDDPALNGLLRHGRGRDGRPLPYAWNRLDGEAVFAYVLGAGAAPGKALAPECWKALRPFYGTVAGYRFNNADLGLFAFEYGMDLIDWTRWRAPGPVDLYAEAGLATRANRAFCREAGFVFETYRRGYWGLSNGDGPGDPPQTDTYRVYGPGEPLDGTADLMSALAAIAHAPEAVLENLERAEHEKDLGAHGRYGFSNINLDRQWVGRDMVGIDAGAAVLALDNYLTANRVRRVFSDIPCVRQGMERLGFTRLTSG